MTPRQKQLLKAIIEEFIETATAVGSLNIPEKYNIKASPATIRNEMAKLVKEGYLRQMHSSSGRLPTTVGMKFYLQELIEQLDEVEHKQEFEIRENLYQVRHNSASLLKNAIQSLIELTGNAAVILINDHIYYGGLSNLIDMPEFQGSVKIKALLNLLEDYNSLMELFNSYKDTRDIKILIGEETGIDGLLDFAVVFTPLKYYSNSEGFISVLGPNRMHYEKVVPSIRFIANTIEDVIKGW